MMDLYTSMAKAATVDLVSADSVKEEFDNILKYRPHYMVLFLSLADMMVAEGADRLDARGLMSVMRWFGKKLTKKKVGIGNQFSQYFVDEAGKRRPDLKPYFTRQPDREKPFKKKG